MNRAVKILKIISIFCLFTFSCIFLSIYHDGLRAVNVRSEVSHHATKIMILQTYPPTKRGKELRNRN